jgi:hypothetical protein
MERGRRPRGKKTPVLRPATHRRQERGELCLHDLRQEGAGARSLPVAPGPRARSTEVAKRAKKAQRSATRARGLWPSELRVVPVLQLPDPRAVTLHEETCRHPFREYSVPRHFHSGLAARAAAISCGANDATTLTLQHMRGRPLGECCPS